MSEILEKTRLGNDPVIGQDVTFIEAEIGRYTEIGDRTTISHSRFGDYSYIMQDGDILYADIGKFCSIAARVRINAPNHPTWRAAQHHFTYRSADYWPDADMDIEFFDWRQRRSVTIGNDVWIGHGATILSGVTIGDGAVVGSGAVVRRDVAPYSIVGGVPSKSIRERFPAEIAERLMALAWWDWDHDRIKVALSDFRELNIVDFLAKYDG